MVDSLIHKYKLPLPSFVPNFRIASQVVPEKVIEALEPANYRQISLTCILCKVMEHIKYCL